ncbi:hypothetical protein [Burkholderia stagnalis]|uniref:hypothetical protein n=1 Tax=Burkholderia stagnalis TaxID=1503054 RepID=UPI000AD1DD32|nr:hypothetical protein [Burkholderia stagnalis]
MNHGAIYTAQTFACGKQKRRIFGHYGRNRTLQWIRPSIAVARIARVANAARAAISNTYIGMTIVSATTPAAAAHRAAPRLAFETVSKLKRRACRGQCRMAHISHLSA